MHNFLSNENEQADGFMVTHEPSYKEQYILKNIISLVILLGSFLTQSCANIDGSEVAVQAAKRTLEHQQSIDKEQGRDRSSEIEKESLINGGIAAVSCTLFSDKCKKIKPN